MDRRDFLKACGFALASSAIMNSVFADKSQLWSKNPRIKPIIGSWFEFAHGSAAEGKYWNGALPNFTEQQWKAKVKEISGTGMEYLVLMAVANYGKTFYPSSSNRVMIMYAVIRLKPYCRLQMNAE